jgi:hypothetical protein
MRFEVLTAVKIPIFFWVVRPCSPEDGDRMFLRNFGNYLLVYTASQPKATTLALNQFVFLGRLCGNS